MLSKLFTFFTDKLLLFIIIFYSIPLAAGLFNRDIYLEGIRRRAAAMDDSQGTSKVCSLQ